jgi:phosphonate metabolism protein (transferase hexapeptide repeat family)
MKYIDVYPDSLRGWKGKQLSAEPTIHENCRIYKSSIGSWTELMRGTSLVESTFGDYSYTAGDVSIIYSDVGKFCSIASHVRINPGNHATWRVTQHHATYRRFQYGFDMQDDEEFFNWRRAHRCVIGHDVWMGHGAIVLPGVKIGTGAVIAAGAVVTKDVGPYEIVGGVPARLIRKRFSDEVIERLLASSWWDWDRDKLETRFEDLLDLDAFLEKYTVWEANVA